MDYNNSDDRDNTEIKESFFAGATITACLFSFLSCLSLVVAVPMLSETSLTISERMYSGARHCNVGLSSIS